MIYRIHQDWCSVVRDTLDLYPIIIIAYHAVLTITLLINLVVYGDVIIVITPEVVSQSLEIDPV